MSDPLLGRPLQHAPGMSSEIVNVQEALLQMKPHVMLWRSNLHNIDYPLCTLYRPRHLLPMMMRMRARWMSQAWNPMTLSWS